MAGEVMSVAQGAGVEVRNVSKSFGADGAKVTVLDDVSLTIGMGEFVSVIGPSGCGKSTLLKVVAGLLDADSGTVTIDGESVTAASRDKKIGLVPQSPALLPWKTVRENVELPVRINAKANSGRALRDPAELLATFGLGQAMKKYPRPALRRHAAACRDRQGVRVRPGHHADGRAVLGPRRDEPRPAAHRPAGVLAVQPQGRHVRHALGAGGDSCSPTASW